MLGLHGGTHTSCPQESFWLYVLGVLILLQKSGLGEGVGLGNGDRVGVGVIVARGVGVIDGLGVGLGVADGNGGLYF